MARDRSLFPRSFPIAAATATLLAFSPALATDETLWIPDVRLTTDGASSRTEIDGGRNVAVSDQILMIVWSDTRDGNPEIYFKERIAGTWSSDLRLTNHSAASIHPAIGRREGEVRVVWADDRIGHPEIWMKRKILGVWGADSCVTCDAFESARPSIDHTGEHLVWEETKDGNREIYYRQRLESGTWEPEFRISNDASESSHPTVASPHTLFFMSNPGLRIVAWQDHRHGNWEIYSRFRASSFDSWRAETRVSSASGNSRLPSVAVEEDAFCSDIAFMAHWVAWQDDLQGNEEIYFAEGGDGFWWNPPIPLTQTATASQHPSVGKRYVFVVTPFGSGFCSRPAVVWEERTSATSGSIRYSDLASSEPETISALNADPKHASFGFFHETPSPGVVEGSLGVLWTDERDGNEEIYLAEGMTQVVVVSVPEEEATPGDLEISLAGPNPFRSATQFTVSLAKESELSVRVVDATGRLVRELYSGVRPSGTHAFDWDGGSQLGARATAGMYFVVVESGSQNAVRRVIRLP